MGAPGTVGERWADEYDCPPPPSLEERWRARQSESARREVDLAWAAYCGLPDDELGPFLRRLAEYDARAITRAERAALDEARRMAGERRRVEARLAQPLAERL